MKLKVIDVHTHYADVKVWSPHVVEWWKKMGNPEFKVGEFEYNPSNLLELMDRANVEYIVILPERCPKVTGITMPEDVIEFCKHSERFIPFTDTNPNIVTYLYEDFERFVDMGVKGLKIHPVHGNFDPRDSRLYPIYYLCMKRNLPVMFHTGSSVFPGAANKFGNPMYIDEIAGDFPELKIIMAHGGRGFWYSEAQFIVRLRKNVYIDISGLPVRRLKDYFPDIERLKDKFLFGTDWPAVSFKNTIEEFLALDLSQSAKEAILYYNAKGVLGIC
ncbi:MAG: amidohydrolase family protein [Thermosulfidibacteraceae bacterium]|jgi:predicted TIM-barrel fold metal-dependent hydrolase